mmetsp:Transcript_23502/g.38297  ORF Transcript_23502/g.38297 Transcript_23502/m.38297 type:complete len:93 (+) Transcript_23502:976-1254(+)
MPASMSLAKPSSDHEAGPMVHTILVRRCNVLTGAVTISRVMNPPAKVGTSEVFEMDMMRENLQWDANTILGCVKHGQKIDNNDLVRYNNRTQ